MPPSPSWRFPPFRLDPATGSLWRDEQLVPLPPKPFAVLATLVAQAGHVVTKEALFNAVWPETAVTEGVLKGCVRQIRQVLGETADAPRYIATVHRRLSEVYLLTERPEDARILAARALGLAQARQERGHQAWGWHLLGKMAAQCQPPEFAAATTYYHQTLALAEELGMRPLVAHCHLGLGQVYRLMAQREHAHVALSTAVTLYQAMEMPFWLAQAEMACAHVAGR